MLSAPRIVKPLKLLLVLAVAFALMMLTLSMPGDFADDLRRSPEAAHLLWPMFLATEGGILAFLLIIVCTWRLLTLIEQDRIFRPEALRWVDLLVRTFVVCWLGFCLLAAYLIAVIFFTPELRDPGVPVVLSGAVLIGAVLVMIVAVMRSLLRRATALQSDLDEVL